MATDFEITGDDAPGAAPATRIPEAVWINRPTPGSGGLRRAAEVFAAALLLGVAALAATHVATEPLLSSAVAGAADAAGNAPTGYFPAQFDQGRLVPAEQPPTF